MNNKEYEELELRSLGVLLLRNFRRLVVVALIAGVLFAALGAGSAFLAYRGSSDKYGATVSVMISCDAYAVPLEITKDCAALFTSDYVVDAVAGETGLKAASVKSCYSAEVGNRNKITLTVSGQKNEETALLLANSITKHAGEIIAQADPNYHYNIIGQPKAQLERHGALIPMLVRSAIKYGVVGAVLAAACLAVFMVCREVFDGRVKDEAMAEAAIGLPVLGIIPEADESSAEHKKAFASLRTKLLFSAAEAKVVAIASSSGEEDVYKLAVNLARSMAAAGRRCLLVDADMRGGEMDKCLGISAAEGLSDCLSGKGEASECMLDAEGFKVLLSGSKVEDPSALFLGGEFKSFLDVARSSFDTVILAAAPAGEYTDAAAIGALADGLLLAVRHRFLSASVPAYVAADMKSTGVKLLGTVLTRYDSRKVYSSGGYAQMLKGCRK